MTKSDLFKAAHKIARETKATELLNDCSKAEARCTIIIARFADGTVEAAFDRGSNAGQRARISRALAAFAA